MQGGSPTHRGLGEEDLALWEGSSFRSFRPPNANVTREGFKDSVTREMNTCS